MTVRAYAVEFEAPPRFESIAEAATRETALATAYELKGQSVARLFVQELPSLALTVFVEPSPETATCAADEHLSRVVLFGPGSDPTWVLRVREALLKLGGRSADPLSRRELALLEKSVTLDELRARDEERRNPSKWRILPGCIVSAIVLLVGVILFLMALPVRLFQRAYRSLRRRGGPRA